MLRGGTRSVGSTMLVVSVGASLCTYIPRTIIMRNADSDAGLVLNYCTVYQIIMTRDPEQRHLVDGNL
jgi:hypothetical protein